MGSDDGAVAIIGMACRLPGAPDVDAYWRNLRDGRDCVRVLAVDEIDPLYRAQAREPGYVAAVGMVDEIDRFDAGFFGISPGEAALIDPQHRLFLEAVWTALEDAGHGDPSRAPGAVGVYAGSWLSSYAARARGHVETPADEFHALIGSGLDYLSTFVSYKLDLTGESVTVQTACSTSLVAVHMACQSLLSGQTDLAVAGGVSIDARQNVGYLHQEGMVGSRDGRCRPFDHRASGTVRGYGLGAVVLRRLADARAEGDPIRAVILGSATNNDGREKIGYTAPSLRGQAEVITTALEMAGVDGDSITYVEAHGTGTPLGDPIEVQALSRAFASQKRGACRIGSVKSSIGHLVEAAGVAGLIKAVLALEQGEIPPTLHFERLNPRLELEGTPFLVADRLAPFPGAPRRAGVSSFGIGGTNAHVVLEQAPSAPAAVRVAAAEALCFTLSARSAAALAETRGRLRAWLEANPQAALRDVAHTLAAGRARHEHRWACVAAGHDELLAALAAGDHPVARAGVAAARRGRGPAGREAPRGDRAALLRAAAEWVAGEEITWETQTEGARRLRLPTYPFQRERHWIDPQPGGLTFGTAWWLEGAAAGAAPTDDARARLLLIDAPGEAALDRRLAGAAALAATGDLDELCAAVNLGGGGGAQRASVLFRGRDELVARLGALRAGEEPPGTRRGGGRAPRLVWSFGGQGGPSPDVGELLGEEAFARALAEVDAAFRALAGRSPADDLARPEPERSRAQQDVQAWVFAVQAALAALWRSWGVEPDAIVGHSIGEVGAAHAAGALSLEDAVRVIHHRSEVVSRTTELGRTLFVGMPLAALEALLAEHQLPLSIATVNDDAGTTVGGPTAAIEALLARLGASGTFCRLLDLVTYPAHSRELEPLRLDLERALDGIRPRPARVPFYSTVHAAPVPGESLDAAYWGHNLRQTVQYRAAVERMLDDGHDAFLEVSHHPVLSHSLERILAARGREGVVAASLEHGQAPRAALLGSAARLFAAGRPVTWPPPASATPARRPAPRAAADVATRLRRMVAGRLGVAEEVVAGDALLVDLGLSSVQMLSLLSQVKRELGASLLAAEMLALGTVDAIARRIERGGAAEHPTVVPLRRRKGAGQVVLFPGAGGGAVMMSPWVAPGAIDDLDAVAVNLPGHADDPRAPLTDVGAMAALVAGGLDDTGPRLLVGFSLGGLVAFEVARRLEQAGRAPRAVLLVHAPAPGAWRSFPLRSDSPAFDQAFGALHEGKGGRPEALAPFLAAARADFRAAEGYHPGGAPLACPVVALASPRDTLVAPPMVEAWRAHAERFELHTSAGDHFDFVEHDHNRALLARLVAAAQPR